MNERNTPWSWIARIIIDSGPKICSEYIDSETLLEESTRYPIKPDPPKKKRT